MARCPKCGGAMLTERPHVHRKPDPTAGTPRTDPNGHYHVLSREWMAGAPCPDCGAVRDYSGNRKRAVAAIDAGTHEWAVDDFGNQYVARVEAEASGTGLDVDTLRLALEEWSGLTKAGWRADKTATAIAAIYARLSVPPEGKEE